jgi:hypothetical protein
VVNQPLKKFSHLFPAFLSCPIKNSGEKERDFVEDFILSADQTVDFMIHELEVNLHKLIGHFTGLVIGEKFGDDFESGYLDNFVTVFGERKQGIGKVLFFVFGELDQLRDNFNTCLSYTPDFFEALLEIKVIDHFLVKELRGDVFAHDFEFSNDLLFDSDAGFVIKFGVLFDKEVLIFFRSQVRSHFGNELDGDYFILLVVVMAHFDCSFDDLFFLFRAEPVFERGQNAVGIFFDLNEGKIT